MSSEPAAAGVDFHCHLDLYPDHPAAMAEAEAAGVFTLAVTTTPMAWPRNRDLTQGLRFVRPALGLHPQLVGERAHELSIWARHLHETRYVGEVGLDAGPRFYKSFDLQKRVFQAVLEQCADAGNKVLSVHSVRSAPTVLDMIEATLPPDRGRVVLHWFTGSRADAARAVTLGCYFSINPQMAAADRGRALIAALPGDRLLTETDGPFTSSQGRRAVPTDISRAEEAMAEIRGGTAAAIRRDVLGNLRALLAGAPGRPSAAPIDDPLSW